MTPDLFLTETLYGAYAKLKKNNHVNFEINGQNVLFFEILGGSSRTIAYFHMSYYCDIEVVKASLSRHVYLLSNNELWRKNIHFKVRIKRFRNICPSVGHKR